jgi:hypothetical protein
VRELVDLLKARELEILGELAPSPASSPANAQPEEPSLEVEDKEGEAAES